MVKIKSKYGIFYRKLRTSVELFEQLEKVNLVFFLIFLIVSITSTNNLWNEKSYAVIWIQIFWTIVFFRYVLQYIRSKDKTACRSPLNKIRTHGFLLGLILILVLFSLDPLIPQFKWDGLLYYKTCKNLSLYSISNLALYGHIAQTYGFLVELVSLIVIDTAAAMVLVNIGLLVASTVAFYGIIKKIIPGQKELTYTLGAAVYAFSPFYLGMVNYYNLDFPLQCLVTVLFYFMIKKKWLYFIATAFLFCFTKEPAVIAYFAVCVGLIVVDMIERKEKSFILRLSGILRTKRYYAMLLPGILWFATYKMLGPWSAGNGGIAFDWTYIIEKCKVLFALNFNWIFVLLSLIFFIMTLVKKDWRKHLSWLIPLILIQIFGTVFSFVFKTVNHPRYSDSNLLTIYLPAIIFVLLNLKNVGKQVALGTLGVLMLLSSYFTIDPITRMVFRKVDIGGTTMVATQNSILGDGMIYNKQMLFMEETINMALQNLDLEQVDVCVPALNNSTYYFDGMADVKQLTDEDLIVQTEIYNPSRKRREPLKTDKNKEFNIYSISENIDLEQQTIGEKDTFAYLYLDGIGDELASQIKNVYPEYEEHEYQYRGWNLKCIICSVYKGTEPTE